MPIWNIMIRNRAIYGSIRRYIMWRCDHCRFVFTTVSLVRNLLVAHMISYCTNHKLHARIINGVCTKANAVHTHKHTHIAEMKNFIERSWKIIDIFHLFYCSCYCSYSELSCDCVYFIIRTIYPNQITFITFLHLNGFAVIRQTDNDTHINTHTRKHITQTHLI